MKNKVLKLLLFFICVCIINTNFCYAENYKGRINGTGVRLRKGPGTNYGIIKDVPNGGVYNLLTNTTFNDEGGCQGGWYKLYYEGTSTGYVCSKYLVVYREGESTDAYGRPWTTPKKAIVGGAKFIAKSYIEAGQFTSYLKKFNVNPNGKHKVYNHQYMENLRAPYSESYSSYKSYRDNNLLNLPLEFTIPVFENMPAYTALLGENANTTCQSTVTDQAFENALNAQRFPESYKCKLRLIHNIHPNWTFKALHTGLDFRASVLAEKAVSSIQGKENFYEIPKTLTEPGWYVANYEAVAYFLDPRNFLNEERILMFENLAYSSNYTEAVVQSVLAGTFMADYSFLDNQSYASIFVEAGQAANVSAVYLASLARQESGTKGSKATTGAEFTYGGVTYKGLFNFFNIGAYSSEGSPVLAGLVYASGGSDSVIVQKAPTGITEANILAELKVTKQNNCMVGLTAGMTLKDVQNRLSGITLTIDGATDSTKIRTGQIVRINDGKNIYTYTMSVKGDVDGDGNIGATDYVKIKNYIMEKSGSDLNVAQSLASDVDNSGSIGATDYVKIKKSIMER